METISLALERDAIAKLDASAKKRDISRERALTEAIERMWADDLLLEEAVSKGRDCIARGDLYTQAEIEEENAALRAEILGRIWRQSGLGPRE